MAPARDERLMGLALIEAERGRGRTHPNPVVGAVVVSGGRVIARGHHAQAGGPHAEIVALREAGARARGAEIYVTLEPHDHHGRTPPCSEALIAAGVARVVIGSIDPNPLVRGRGVHRMRAAGLEVVIGVQKVNCDSINESWFKFITTGFPWVHLKAAITLDGKLATASGDSRWVTGPASRLRVHQLRDQLDAVLVGIGTAIADNPRLTVRGVPGGRDPIRVVVDSLARLSPRARLLPALVACTSRAPPARVRRLEKAGSIVLRCRGAERVDLEDLLRQLAGRGLTSLLVEGGAALHGSFLAQGLWDELSLFVAPKLAGESALSWAGLPGSTSMKDALPLRIQSVDSATFAPDLLLRARPARGTRSTAARGGRTPPR